MKYYETNTLIIEYPAKFLATGKTIPARAKWNVAFTTLTGEKIQFIPKNSLLAGKKGERGHRARYYTILVDIYMQKEDFVDAITQYFSNLLKVRPQDLHFRFEEPQPFGDLK